MSGKGLVSGATNLAMGLLLVTSIPSFVTIDGAMLLGFLAYGVSLTLFVIVLRHLGTARTGAYFSIAPFFGALLALMLGESVTLSLIAAGVLMAIELYLHLTKSHEYSHMHEAMDHEHEHAHVPHAPHRHQP